MLGTCFELWALWIYFFIFTLALLVSYAFVWLHLFICLFTFYLFRTVIYFSLLYFYNLSLYGLTCSKVVGQGLEVVVSLSAILLLRSAACTLFSKLYLIL